VIGEVGAPSPKMSKINLIALGLAAGFLSGVFGVGGGTVIVPALVLWFAVAQKKATGTSVAAILPTAIFGTLSYGLQGALDWVAAGALALGVFVGAQFGSAFLTKLRVGFLQGLFMCFLVAVIVSLWFVVPERDDVIPMTPIVFSLLIVLGLVTGLLGGILGVGGGIIVVPVLIFFFGASDLIAKGTSLAMMIPGSLSGTIGNIRRKNVDLASASIIGVSASVMVPVGLIVATVIEPLAANIAFSVFLALILAQMLARQIRGGRSARS
jgi:uncharacterized membrane protein YfcA